MGKMPFFAYQIEREIIEVFELLVVIRKECVNSI